MNELNNTKGTYVAVRPDAESFTKLTQYIQQHKIPNPVPLEKLHATLIRSRVPLVGFQADPNIRHIATPISFTIFKTRSPDPQTPGWDALVMRLACNTLSDRHRQLMTQYEGEYEFGKYEPHLTISYKMDPTNIAWLPHPDFKITLTHEYTEELNLNWAAEHGVKKD